MGKSTALIVGSFVVATMLAILFTDSLPAHMAVGVSWTLGALAGIHAERFVRESEESS